MGKEVKMNRKYIQKMNSKMVDLNPVIPIIILYANATNTQLKKEILEKYMRVLRQELS